MELLKARVRSTDEEVFVKPDIGGFKCAFTGRLFAEDDLEFIDPRTRKSWASDFSPAEYMERVLNMQQDNYWRDQRVEITKILLQRMDFTSSASTGDVVKIADDIIQQLKQFND